MTNLQSSDNVNYMTPEKMVQVFDYVLQGKLNPKEGRKKWRKLKLNYDDIVMIFKIAYHAGLRVNEVLKLKKSDFNFELLEIILGKTKTEQRGLASIPNSFADELKKYLNQREDGLLFPISRQTAYQWIMQIGKDLNISAWTTPQSETREKTKTHLFRKSVGKDMLYKKAPLNIIQRKLRHNNINTTSEYLKIKLNDVKNWENENL